MKKKTAAAVLSAVMALSIPAVSNASLDSREINIVPIAAYTAQGNEQALKKALTEGLNNGLTVNEIKGSPGADVRLYGLPKKSDRFRSGLLIY